MRKLNKKVVALLVSLTLVLTIAVGGTLAYLVDKTGSVVNKFNPSSVTTEVYEEREGNVKKNVKIQNTGDTTAYIRAAVVVTWQDASGNVYGQVPVLDTDYTISFNTEQQENPEGKWTLAADGFYYWNSPVNAGDNTGVLITEAKLKDGVTAPKVGDVQYYLCIEILGSGVQSKPASVVTDVWSSGVSSVSGTTLTIK